MAEAGGLQAEYEERAPKGGMFLEILIENLDYETPSQEELSDWRDTYGLKMPVLADAGESVMYSFAAGMSSVGLPFTVVLDRGLVVDKINGNLGDMDALLEE